MKKLAVALVVLLLMATAAHAAASNGRLNLTAKQLASIMYAAQEATGMKLRHDEGSLVWYYPAEGEPMHTLVAEQRNGFITRVHVSIAHLEGDTSADVNYTSGPMAVAIGAALKGGDVLGGILLLQQFINEASGDQEYLVRKTDDGACLVIYRDMLAAGWSFLIIEVFAAEPSLR